MILRKPTLLSTLAGAILILPCSLTRGEDAGQDKVLGGPKVEASELEGQRRRFAGPNRRGPRHGKRFGRFLEQFQLDEEQKAKIHRIMDEYRQKHERWRHENGKQLEQIRKQMQQLREKMHALMSGAPKPTDMAEKIRPILSAEQQKVMDEKMKKMKKSDRRPGKHKMKHRGERKRRKNRDQGENAAG